MTQPHKADGYPRSREAGTTSQHRTYTTPASPSDVTQTPPPNNGNGRGGLPAAPPTFIEVRTKITLRLAAGAQVTEREIALARAKRRMIERRLKKLMQGSDDNGRGESRTG